MNSVFGIHVGNTNASLSICSDNFVRVISNNAGDRVMPAMVTFLDEETIVGTACKSLVHSKRRSTVVSNKRMLDGGDVEENIGRNAKIVVKDGEVFYEIPSEEGDLKYKTPADVLSCIYQTLYCLAKEAIHAEEVSCVLLVPEYFSEEAKMQMQAAAEDVGWEVLQVINESAAAVLGYNIFSEDTLPVDQKILVYRAGGSSVDISLLDLDHGMLTILGSEHSDKVGGNVLVTAVTKYLADEFYRRYKLDPTENHRSWTKLTQAAENCLQVLSNLETSKCFVESLCEGVDFDYTFSRARFESLLSPLLEMFTKPLNSLFSRLDTSSEQVFTVVLCGGLMKIPRLKKCISDEFPEAGTHIIALPKGINYDEVLACGAARQAGHIISSKLRGRVLATHIDISVLEHPLTVEVEGGNIVNGSSIDIPTIDEPFSVQKERGDILENSLYFEARRPLPIHKSLSVSCSGSKIKLIFTQVISPLLVLKGEVELDGLEDPDDLALEIDSENIKVIVASEIGNFHIVKMNSYHV